MTEDTLSTLSCRLCRRATKDSFNIQLVAVPICDLCATAITLQQVKYWAIDREKAQRPLTRDDQANTEAS